MMIIFNPSAQMAETIIQKGKEAGMPGMGGGFIDARPHIRKLVSSLYDSSYVFAQLYQGPVVDRIFSQLQHGETANVGNMAIFEPDQASKQVIIAIGNQAGIPGMSGGLFDSRKYVEDAVDRLAAEGVRLVFLAKSQATAQIWDRLNQQTTATINEW